MNSSRVEVSGPATSSNFGMVSQTCSVAMTDVTVAVSGGPACIGVQFVDAAYVMTGVTVSATLGTTFNTAVTSTVSAAPARSGVISGSTIFAGPSASSYGLGATRNVGGGAHEVLVQASKVTGATNSVGVFGTAVVRAGASLLGGGPVAAATGAVVSCAGVHDENTAFFASTCP